MKKNLAISLFFLLVFSIVSCGGSKKDPDTADSAPDGGTGTNDTGPDTVSDADPDSGSDNDADTGPVNDGDHSPAPDGSEKNDEGCYIFTVDGSTFSRYYRDTYLGYVKDNILGDKTVEDKFEIDIFQSRDSASSAEIASHPGTYDLGSGSNKSLLNCTECVKVFQDHDGKRAKKNFFQESGTLVIEQVDADNDIKGKISAKLVEITIDPDTKEAEKVEGGECVAIENWAFDTGVCIPDCNGKVCGGDGCGGQCGEGCSGDLTCSKDQKSCVPFECEEITLGQITLGNNGDKDYYEAYAVGRSAGSTELDDIFQLYFYTEDSNDADTITPGVADLGSGYNAEFATCTECILFYEDIDDSSEATEIYNKYNKLYFQQSGELVFEEVKEGTLESRGHGHFRIVEIDDYDFSPVPNGKCYEVKNLQWNTIQP
ncbi:hypothetical protein IKP13_04320 [bacterium]|nr:hypothetical protein [bacterium]